MSTVTEKSATKTRFARWRNGLVLIPQVLLLWFWARKYHANEFRVFVRDYLAVQRSGLFLPKFYNRVSKRSKGKFGFLSHVASIAHFLEIGVKEGLNPNPLFSVDFYLNSHPDVRASRMNPLVHYILFGGSEGRSTHLLFDGWYYQERFVGEISQTDTPLRDFLRKGATGTRNPCLLFDCAHYLKQKPDLKDCANNPLIHYLLVGARTGFDPHPYFSSNFYLEKYQHEVPKEASPLEFFLDAGGHRYHQPSPQFDCSYYLEVYPDIKKAGVIPLVHYLEFGHRERRHPEDLYGGWVSRKANNQQTENVDEEISRFSYRPLISVIVPVFNTDEIWLKAAINSVIDQVYPHWELCIADDGSTPSHVRTVLDEYRSRDERIKVTYRPESGHISAASNTALSMASGDFIALLDHDDLLDRFALFENARLLNLHPRAEIIYSDEDKINKRGLRYEPYFKPDWSPELLLLQMYLGHLGVYKRALIEKIGGFREGYEGSQDYDLILRASELTDEIYHIPKVLYHWRTIDGSTAADPKAKAYAYLSGEKALQDAITRRGLLAKASQIPRKHGMYTVSYENDTSRANKDMLSGIYSIDFTSNKYSTLSLIIPSSQNSGRLERLTDTLRLLLPYLTSPEIDIIVVLGGSENSDISRFIADLEVGVLSDVPASNVEEVSASYKKKVIVVDATGSSLHSQLINIGVRHARGKFLCFLDESTISISHQVYDDPGNWLEQMTGYAQSGQVGAVGGLIVDHRNDVVISSGILINEDGVVADMHRGESIESAGYFGRLLGTSNCTAVRLGCLVTRRDLFEKIGGLDESLPDELVDVDYGLWLQDSGYRSVMLSQFRFAQTPREIHGAFDKATDKKNETKKWQLFVERWGALLSQSDPYYSPNLKIVNQAAKFNLDV